jgi:pyrimidine operon attenuation protein/uracil phosphoribosyltransferase
MNPTELDAEVLFTQLEQAVGAGLAGTSRLAIVGIYSGGAWIAERLATSLGVADLGFVDVSFFRDD